MPRHRDFRMEEKVWIEGLGGEEVHGQIIGTASSSEEYKGYIMLLNEPLNQADGQRVRALVVFGAQLKSKLDILK